ncbi:transglutaminase [alpha proteobacterium AAP81b]|nr:transglutaminase [alpha proteobacterium AAP81b]
MRIRVDYTTAYDYAETASHVVQLLRVEPVGHDAQHVIQWRIDADRDGHLRRGTDSFGNIVHMFYADAPLRRLAVHVSGEVETEETLGIVAGGPDRLPIGVYLRSTPLTAADDAIAAFARDCVRATPFETAHALSEAVSDRIAFDTDITHPYTDAAHAFAAGAGVCQDNAHIYLAAARHIGLPARYVSGHFVRNDGIITQPATHAWAEAHVEGFGWIGFDPVNRRCITEEYLRVAIGLDYLDAAPVRGTRRGGGMETLSVSVTTRNLAPAQALSQSQFQMAGQSQA